MSLESQTTPVASIEALLLAPDAGNFQTELRQQLEFSLDPNGIVGDKRHNGNSTKADVRTKRVYKRGREVPNRQSVSIVDASDLDYIAARLGIDEEVVYENMAVDLRVGLTAPQARRLFLASCMGANVLLGEYKGTEETTEFRNLSRGLDLGPFDPENDNFTDATVLITRPNAPCVGPGKKIRDNYPGSLPDTTPRDFVDIAEGRRGFVGMVAKPGSMAVGELVQFVLFGD